MVSESITYAGLAGLPPEVGLYTAFFSSWTYWIFLTLKDSSIGTITVAEVVTGNVIAAQAHDILLKRQFFRLQKVWMTRAFPFSCWKRDYPDCEQFTGAFECWWRATFHDGELWVIVHLIQTVTGDVQLIADVDSADPKGKSVDESAQGKGDTVLDPLLATPGPQDAAPVDYADIFFGGTTSSTDIGRPLSPKHPKDKKKMKEWYDGYDGRNDLGKREFKRLWRASISQLHCCHYSTWQNVEKYTSKRARNIGRPSIRQRAPWNFSRRVTSGGICW